MAKIAALVTEPVDRPNSMKSLEEHILKLVKVGQDFKHAAQMHQDAASQQVNSMRNLEAAIEKLANRNYHEIRSSTEAVNKLVSLKFLRTALFTRRLLLPPINLDKNYY